MNSVFSKLWLWFWHLIPANPILVRVVHGASRRPRHLWLRVGYLSALMVVVLFSLVGPMSGQSASLTELAKGASQTFKYASTTQLALMCFLAPVFTAAAITQERDAQTFNILISTPMTNAQIVFGSLMSRLFFVLLLLLSGLPIFLMTMVYGGVTTSQIIESFAISGATALLTGALAICVAMIRVGTRRTIFSFYLLIALYLLVLYVLGQWQGTEVAAAPANYADQRMSWLTPLHPFLALDVAMNRVQAPALKDLVGYGSIARYALAFPSAVYLAWTLSAAFLLTVFSVIFVRRGIKVGEPTVFSAITERFTRRTVGDRTRNPRSVWNNPVAWQEAKTRATDTTWIRWTIIIGGIAASLILFYQHAVGSMNADDARKWLSRLILVQYGIALLIAINTAATSMSKERDAKSIDLLLVTLLTSKKILWGKLRGLVSFTLPLVAGPTLMLLLFGVYGFFGKTSPPAIWLEAGIEVGALMVIYVAAACVISLQISLTARKSVTAVMYSVGVMILLCGLFTVVGMAIISAAGGVGGAFVAGFTPFTAIMFIVDPMPLFEDSAAKFAAGAAGARVATFLGSAIACGVYSLIILSIYNSLVRNFDMTMRKQSGL